MRQFYNILVVLFAFGFSMQGFSQVNLLNASDPADIGKRDQMQVRQDEDKKLEYGYVDERDIMFSKVICEGDELSGHAKRAIDRARKGSLIRISEIETRVVGSSANVPAARATSFKLL